MPKVVHFSVPGHLPGLDWQLWFIPLRLARGSSELPAWYQQLVKKPNKKKNKHTHTHTITQTHKHTITYS